MCKVRLTAKDFGALPDLVVELAGRIPFSGELINFTPRKYVKVFLVTHHTKQDQEISGLDATLMVEEV